MCGPRQGVLFGPKAAQIDPKSDKTVTFSDQFQSSKDVLKFDLKNPGFVPFWANLTHFGAEHGIPRAHVIYSA